MKFLLVLMGFINGYPNLPGQASTVTNHGQPPIRDVSLSQLLANPEKYDGQLVRLTGYLNLAYEAHAIYGQQDDLANRRLKNGLWVDFSAAIRKEKKLADYNRTYVVVVGTFDAHSKGHLGLFGGTLKNIISLDKQPLRR